MRVTSGVIETTRKREDMFVRRAENRNCPTKQTRLRGPILPNSNVPAPVDAAWRARHLTPKQNLESLRSSGRPLGECWLDPQHPLGLRNTMQVFGQTGIAGEGLAVTENLPLHKKRDADLFRRDGRLIVSYPKSGRTWLRFALAEGGIDASFNHAGVATHRREIGRPFLGIPPSVQGMPVVFLHREPIDTAVSMFYQVTRRDLRRGSGRWLRICIPLALRGAIPPTDIDAFVLHPLYGVEKVVRFNRAWLDYLAKRTDSLVLTYETMQQDPVTGFQRLLDHWGETGKTGADLAELSRFDRMKAVEASNAGPDFLRTVVAKDVTSAKVRKGKVGGYRDELKPETIQRCNEIAARYGFGQEV